MSNYCPSCFECLRDVKVKPMVNQLRYHIGMGADPEGYVSYCKEHGCVMQGYGSRGNPPLDPMDPVPPQPLPHEWVW